MGRSDHGNPIDPKSGADTVLSLLSQVNSATFPHEERMAVATVQVEALDAWLAADAAKPPPPAAKRRGKRGR